MEQTRFKFKKNNPRLFVAHLFSIPSECRSYAERQNFTTDQFNWKKAVSWGTSRVCGTNFDFNKIQIHSGNNVIEVNFQWNFKHKTRRFLSQKKEFYTRVSVKNYVGYKNWIGGITFVDVYFLFVTPWGSNTKVLKMS